MPVWRGRPNTRTLPTVLLTPPASKAADMAHLCVPQNQALGVCRRFVPDIQVCGTHSREDLVNASITSNAEEEELSWQQLLGSSLISPPHKISTASQQLSNMSFLYCSVPSDCMLTVSLSCCAATVKLRIVPLTFLIIFLLVVQTQLHSNSKTEECAFNLSYNYFFLVVQK